MGTHFSGERPFVCFHDDCTKRYTREWHLRRHIQAAHTVKEESDAKLKCPFSSCEKLFKTRCSLNKHVKNIHEKRKYVCSVCSKSFRKNQHLKSHEYEHTGIKPFLCQHEGCGKRFIVPSKLKRHMKIHEGYKCDVDECNAVFETWTLLVQHRKTSHPLNYICDICKKKFKTRFNLQNHLTVHEENRIVFHCSYENCSRFYFDKRNLSLHIKIHHEGRKFSCTHEGCNEQFAYKKSLKYHLKLHSEGNTEKLKSRRNRNRSAHYKDKKKLKKKEADYAAFLSGFDSSKKPDEDLNA
ncbi:transcription factor IIIA-like [Centruroides vittatus]|uniref:transcription factor IIIA-like n=1 Tax=Centruroides vittatus TaxID=120091 RepID=UPI003510039B